jgi:multiple sugar transport system ATP-binding protein
MRTEISKLHTKLNATIIYVTHDQTEAMTMGDRIVVMKDGIMQQSDTPLNIYNNPVNLFVAGFIGSPAMNFINGKIKADGKYKFISEDGSFSLNLEFNSAEKLSAYTNRSVVLGIRPEDIYSEPNPGYNFQKYQAKLEVAEPMGNETILYFKISDSQFVARFPAIEKPQPGANIDLYINSKKLHFFSKDTGEGLYFDEEGK